VTRHLGQRCEECLSLVGGVRCTGTEGPRDFRELVREIAAYFPIDLQPLVSGMKTGKRDYVVRTFYLAAVQL